MKTPKLLRFAFGALLAAATARAAELPLIGEAREAIGENIPEVAVEKLRQALANMPVGSEAQVGALALLAEAQLNASHPEDVLETLAQLSDPGPAATKLRAMALMALARWDEALPHLRTLANHAPDAAAAHAGEAECLQALGRTREAMDVLQPVALAKDAPVALRLRLASLLVELGRTDEARPLLHSTAESTPTVQHWQRYIQARIHLLEKKPLAALDDLAPLLGDAVNPQPAGLTQNLRAAATLAEADARLAAGGPETAEKVLEAFIRQNPESPHIETIFRRLDQIYALDPSTDEGPLSRMAAELPPQTAALAQYHLARAHMRAKRNDRSDATLNAFLTRFPEHRLTPYVHTLLAENAKARGDLTGAETALDAASRTAQTETLRGELALQTALLNLQQEEFVRASTGFRNAALRSPALKINALYDSALAWLRQKNFVHFREDLAAFTAESTDPVLAGNLRIEEGLVHARAGDKEAQLALRAFLVDFKGHPRRPEAQLALAELALNDGNAAEAQKLQRAVVATETTPELREQAEYLGIFLDDAQTPRNDAQSARNEEQAIARGRDFIRQHPASAVLGEVRMKLGEIYFRREDYLNAQEQFETLAREQPDGPHATAALFLAGQCSMKLLNTASLNRALELFGAVVEKHGPLEAHARLHQALVKTKLGAPDDAVKIYDNILSAQPPVDPELRLAALTGKADNLVALGKTDPKQFTAAIASYDQVIATAAAPPSWRNQAAYKKAKTLEQQDQSDAALVIFYDILKNAATGPRETFWFAKAGFDAAALVESRQQWKSAVGLYEKMAAIPGPHAEQARQRVRKLRLEHFLWD
jgi:tetratricopeptide (TPR) repeat protein